MGILGLTKLGRKIGSVVRGTRLNKGLLREGEELLSSRLPFKGDYFVSGGKKLANGPKTFAQELRSFKFKESEIEETTKIIGSNPDLYTVFSRELNNITKNKTLKNIPFEDFKEMLMRDIREIAPYLERNPDKLKLFVGYDKFLAIRTNTNIALGPDALLLEGIYDFDTAAKLMESLAKHKKNFYHFKELPEIMKNSTIPNEHLTGLFDDLLNLSESKIEFVQSFTEQIQPIINKKDKQLYSLINELASNKAARGEFKIEKLETLVKNLNNKKQVELFTQHLSDNTTGVFTYDLFSKGLLDNEYQIELYKTLKDIKFKISSSDFSGQESLLERFPRFALEDILKNVKNETDFQIVKIMAEKRGVKGRDLYSPSAIVRILEQSPEKKVQILEKIKKPLNYDKIRSDEELLQKCRDKYYTEQSTFQKELKSFPAGQSLTEIQSLIPQGEVALVGEKLMVNNGEKLVELKLSQKDFQALFLSEHFTFQGQVPDCGLVSTLDTLMATPKGRAHIYSLFESVPNSDDILVNLHRFNTKIRFKDGILKDSRGMDSTKGLKMLEHAICAVETRGVEAKNGIITMYEDCSFIAGNDSPIRGINPTRVLEHLVGENSFRSRSSAGLDSEELKNILSKIDTSNNRFAILSTSSDDNVFLSINKLIRGNHYHGIRKANPDMSFNVVNPHFTNLSSRLNYYTITNGRRFSMTLCELI